MNSRNIWTELNRPFVITVIVIAVFITWNAMKEPRLAREIRGAYEELHQIVKESSSDVEQSRAVAQFSNKIASQMREGFQKAFNQNKKTKTFLETRKKVSTQGLKFVKSDWASKQPFVFQLYNGSSKHLTDFTLNYEFYRDGELVDVNKESLHNVDVLTPGEKIGVKGTYELPDEKPEKYKAESMRIKILSFSVKDVK